MKNRLYCVFMGALGLLSLNSSLPEFTNPVSTLWPPAALSASTPTPAFVQYDKSLRFNVYTFIVSAADSGAIRELTVKVYRGSLLLTNFQVRIDGAIAGAEVADLDDNRFPELYVYSTSDGSGSFGRVYAWQFLPEHKSTIVPVNWQLPTDGGYMGHDSLWVERAVLCRKYPVYQSGDGNSAPTGGIQMVRYRLKPVGAGFALVAEPR